MQASTALGTMDAAAYNLTTFAWLTTPTPRGRFLSGIFGWMRIRRSRKVIAYFGCDGDTEMITLRCIGTTAHP
jgi:hypothetical protein